MNLFTNDEDFVDFKIPASSDFDYTYNKNFKCYEIKVPNGFILYASNFFNKKVSDRSLEYFLENEQVEWKKADWRTYDKNRISNLKFRNINWRQDKFNMYGKEIYLPRFSAWYGDQDKTYSYSGIDLKPNKWNKGLLYIKEKIETFANTKFNSVLMNWYRDGNDYINWHSDAEKELGKNPVIGSVNFGATRRFLIRNYYDKSIKLEFPLKHGTLLIMSGALQHFWQHSVPKEKKVKGNRINLTFRNIK